MRHLLLLLGLILLAGCGRDAAPDRVRSNGTNQTLYLWAHESFRTSGLETVLIPDFEKSRQCRVELSLFPDRLSLADAIRSFPDSVDLYMNLDLALADAYLNPDHFLELNIQDFKNLDHELILASPQRMIPYAYSYMSLIYNTTLIQSPPRSFGELQDSRYFRQIGLLNPQSDSWGAAVMHYMLALFGEDGYEHLLKALRKNVYKVYDDPDLMVEAIKSGECALGFAPMNYAMWLSDADPADHILGMQMLQEGSYLFTQNAAVAAQCKKLGLATDFLHYITAESAQKMLLYKGGLLPANSKVMLPQAYGGLPLSVYSYNERLPKAQIRENHENWLNTWQRVFNIY